MPSKGSASRSSSGSGSSSTSGSSSSRSSGSSGSRSRSRSKSSSRCDHTLCSCLSHHVLFPQSAAYLRHHTGCVRPALVQHSCYFLSSRSPPAAWLLPSHPASTADLIYLAKAELNHGFAGHLSNAGAAPPAQAARTGQGQGCAGVML